MTRCFFFFLIFLSLLYGISDASGIERRRDQFQGQPGYYIVPVPYRLTGIGEGVILLAAALNVVDTNADVYGFGFAGDLEGYGAGALDMHLVPRTLIFDITTERINKATLTSYSKRGMDTDKNDYTLVDLGDIEFNLARLTATFFERRLEVYGMGYEAASKLEGIRQRDGTLILDVQEPERDTLQHIAVGARLDLTDDYLDPRKGLRLDISRGLSPRRSSGASDYYVMEYNTTGYVPVGKRSAIALNYFRSDAFVTSTGETDRATIESDRGLDCGTITDPQEQQQCNQVVDNIIAENRYGTASSLGGTSRLRSYSHDRYVGAHSLFYGAEFRWNITEESTPFNIVIMKDIRTAIQAAFFYETGSVVDNIGELGSIMRSSYGAGFRIVTGSGLIFRADVATGSEGPATTMIIGYPWEIF
ncbi:MAG: BamA/TamA family outer membrane protein [Deltaproteobacteria bacterium]|nr:BamA/TamA family outer membrane protein [Deltaproteobacteria bacterium]